MTDVSIIVPIYNSETWLEKCIESLLKQTWRNLEIILVNDGSTDGSQKICEFYAEQDQRVIYLSQKNQGQSTARNTGMDIASGDYIYFLDADDFATDCLIEKCMSVAKRNHCDVLTFDTNLKRYARHLPPNRLLPCRDIIDLNIKNNEFCPVVWLYIYKRSFLLREKIKFIDGVKYEDNLFTYNVLTRKGTCYYLPLTLHTHLVHELSSTGLRPTSYNVKCLITILEKMILIYKEIGKPKEHRKLLKLFSWLPFRISLEGAIFDYKLAKHYFRILKHNPNLMSISLLKSIIKYIFRLGRPLNNRL